MAISAVQRLWPVSIREMVAIEYPSAVATERRDSLFSARKMRNGCVDIPRPYHLGMGPSTFL